tara:strand:+ start:166 stop:297 length:132 start_codon:yes stop_codon:yes gene_type:complete
MLYINYSSINKLTTDLNILLTYGTAVALVTALHQKIFSLVPET